MKTARPTYGVIRDDVRKRVWVGEFRATGKLPGERELARHYGVSHLTMNKALSMLVQEGVLERHSNKGTYVGRKAHTGSCLLHVPSEGHVYHELATRLIRALQREGFATTLADLGVPGSWPDLSGRDPFDLAILDVLNYSPVRLVDTFPAKHYAFFPRYGAPVSLPGLYVLTDYEQGGYEAAKCLEEWGCRKLVAICLPLRPHGITTQWLKGVERRAREGAIQHVEAAVSPGVGCSPQVRTLLQEGRVDGLLSNTDFQIVAAIRCMAELGIPRETVKMVGYYNTPWSESYHFSSFDLRLPQLVSTLIERIHERSFESRTLMAPRLVQRH